MRHDEYDIRPPGVDISLYQCTYLEAVLALEADTQVCLGGLGADWKYKAQLFETAFKSIHNTFDIRVVGKHTKTAFVQLFQSRFLKNTRETTGLWHKGIARRPKWKQGQQVDDAININLVLARQHFETKCGDVTKMPVKQRGVMFGSEFKLVLQPFKFTSTWVPPESVILQSMLNQVKKPKGDGVNVTCFFGHTAKTMKKQNIVPVWRGASLGADLCNACHVRLCYELNTPGVPLVTQTSQPPRKTRKTDLD